MIYLLLKRCYFLPKVRAHKIESHVEDQNECCVTVHVSLCY